MSDPVRIGLVGCGRLAQRGYLPAFAETDLVELTAVADLDLRRCEAIAPGVPAYGSIDELLADSAVQLVVLAHHPSAHVADARRAAAIGIPALVEKPPARSAEEAQVLVSLEPACWLGFNRRFEPAVVNLRGRVAGAPPAALELELSIQPSAWAAFGGSDGVLLDLGPHVVDLALWLSGCRALAVRVNRASMLEAAFDLDLGDTRATLRISHRRGWRERIVVRDARGRTTARLERGGIVRRAAARARPGGRGPLVGSLAGQLAAVAEAIRGGPIDERLAGAADGVAALAVLDAVAAAEGTGWVEL